MRITTAMMTNTTLLHINRNMRNLDEIIRQLETTKKISRPSDDPIIASRALKFRTAVTETEQFQRSVDTGIAWMNISESSFHNVNSELLLSIRNMIVQAANDTNSIENKNSLMLAIGQLVKQIGIEMNQSLAGRHVFSGLRTDEPPVFTSDNSRSFILTQHFNRSEIEKALSFQRLPVNDPGPPPGPMHGLYINEPMVNEIHVLKLAYAGMGEVFPPPAIAGQQFPDPIDGTATNAVPHIPGFHVIQHSNRHPDAYLPNQATTTVPPMPIIHYIQETGELVMHEDTVPVFPREGASVTYQKDGFARGDINPAVYFTSREIIDTSWQNSGADQLLFQVTQYFNREAGTLVTNPLTLTGDYYEFNLELDVYSNANNHDGLNSILPEGAVIDDTVTPNRVYIPAHHFERQQNIGVTYTTEVDNIAANMGANHIMYNKNLQGVRLVRAHDTTGAIPIQIDLDIADLNFSFDMNNQDLTLEFAKAAFVPMNSLAKNIFTDKMFADFRLLEEFSHSISTNERSVLEAYFSTHHVPPLTGQDLKDAVEERLVHETALMRAAFSSKLDNMIANIDGHIVTSTREHTSLGARMLRLELIQSRLEQDHVSLQKLTSSNEDTDMVKAIIQRMNAEAAFQGSLRANSQVVQLTLANFIG